MRKAILTFCVLLISPLGFLASAQAQSNQLQLNTQPNQMERGQTLQRPSGPRGPAGTRAPIGPTVMELTVGECRNLGCTVREAANCPVITHDFGARRWACQCAGGSSCITESSPQ